MAPEATRGQPGILLTDKFINLIFRLALAIIGTVIFVRTDILEHIIKPERLYHLPYRVGTISALLFLATLLWALIWKYVLSRRGLDFRRLRTHTPRTNKVLTISLMATYFAYMVAFIPVFGVLGSLGIFTFLAYTLIALLSFV